jgi:hypothetical protein
MTGGASPFGPWDEYADFALGKAPGNATSVAAYPGSDSAEAGQLVLLGD